MSVENLVTHVKKLDGFEKNYNQIPKVGRSNSSNFDWAEQITCVLCFNELFSKAPRRQGDDLLGGSGMNGNASIQVCFGGAHLHRYAEALRWRVDEAKEVATTTPSSAFNYLQHLVCAVTDDVQTCNAFFLSYKRRMNPCGDVKVCCLCFICLRLKSYFGVLALY